LKCRNLGERWGPNHAHWKLLTQTRGRNFYEWTWKFTKKGSGPSFRSLSTKKMKRERRGVGNFVRGVTKVSGSVGGNMFVKGGGTVLTNPRRGKKNRSRTD